MSIMDAIYKKLLLGLCLLLLSGVLHAQGVYLNKGDIAFALREQINSLYV